MNKYTRIKENYKHVIFIIIKGKSSNFHKYYSSPWHLHNPGENSPRWKKKKREREERWKLICKGTLLISNEPPPPSRSCLPHSPSFSFSPLEFNHSPMIRVWFEEKMDEKIRDLIYFLSKILLILEQKFNLLLWWLEKIIIIITLCWNLSENIIPKLVRKK